MGTIINHNTIKLIWHSSQSHLPGVTLTERNTIGGTLQEEHCLGSARALTFRLFFSTNQSALTPPPEIHPLHSSRTKLDFTLLLLQARLKTQHEFKNSIPSQVESPSTHSTPTHIKIPLVAVILQSHHLIHLIQLTSSDS